MPVRPSGVPRPQAKGLTGSGEHCFFSNNALHAFFILFHHFYTEKQVYSSYFVRITASMPVGQVVIWLAHLAKILFKFHE